MIFSAHYCTFIYEFKKINLIFEEIMYNAEIKSLYYRLEIIFSKYNSHKCMKVRSEAIHVYE